jgi:hypothetical protein
VRLDDLALPDTTAASAACEISAELQSAAMHHHCARSYVWAAALASSSGLAFDAELLYVAAMLHDLGLHPSFDSHAVAFEQSGGDVARVFAAGAGWPAARRDHVAAVVVGHMREVDRAEDAEGHLLARATGIDISGRGVDDVPADLRREVIDRWPRLDLATEFADCFRGQAARKPGTAAARAMASGLADRLAINPLERG